MIRKVQFNNFRCLKDVSLELGPLTALVGPNASGKSSILAGLDWTRLPAPSLGNLWMKRPGGEASIKAHHEGGDVSLLRFGPDGHPIAHSTRHSSQALRLTLGSLRSPNILNEQAVLASDGSNLTNVFASLGRERQSSLAREFCRLVPMFSDVNTKPLHEGFHRLVFQDRWAPDVEYEPGEVSDGSIMMLAYLTIPFQAPGVDLLCIEEPENGLHPYLLSQVVGLLRGLSRGEYGQDPIQVIMATHSAEILNYLDPTEVRICSRTQDGSVKVGQIDPDTEDWKQAYREYDENLGNLWLSGSLGGVPGG